MSADCICGPDPVPACTHWAPARAQARELGRVLAAAQELASRLDPDHLLPDWTEYLRGQLTELTGAVEALVPAAVCARCHRPYRRVRAAGRYCSAGCRQAGHRARHASAAG